MIERGSVSRLSEKVDYQKSRRKKSDKEGSQEKRNVVRRGGCGRKSNSLIFINLKSEGTYIFRL